MADTETCDAICAVMRCAGGIAAYQEAYPDGGLFRGKNFVFDPRISVPEPEPETCHAEAKTALDTATDTDTATATSTSAATDTDTDTDTDAATSTSTSSLASAAVKSTVIGSCCVCSIPYDSYRSGRAGITRRQHGRPCDAK